MGKIKTYKIEIFCNDCWLDAFRLNKLEKNKKLKAKDSKSFFCSFKDKEATIKICKNLIRNFFLKQQNNEYRVIECVIPENSKFHEQIDFTNNDVLISDQIKYTDKVIFKK